MLPHYTWKVKVQICDKIMRTRSTFSRSVMVSVGISKLGVTHLVFVNPGWRYLRQLLSRHAPVAAAVARDVRLVRRFNKTAHRPRETLCRLCDFLGSQHPRSFLHLWPPNGSDLKIRSITRYGVTSSSECISRSCTALTN